jgi:hypothetical protein
MTSRLSAKIIPCGSTAPSRFQKNGWSSATTSAVIVFVHAGVCASDGPAARRDRPITPSAAHRTIQELAIGPFARPRVNWQIRGRKAALASQSPGHEGARGAKAAVACSRQSS